MLSTMILLSISIISKIYAQDQVDEIKPLGEWEETTHDFGKVAKGKPVTATFIVKNVSMVPLVITSVKPTCGCTVADYPKEPVKPGEKAEIKATYNAATPGFFTKTVYVYTNMTETKTTLYMKGEVVNQ